MLRLDRQRLAETRLPFRTELETRFADVDAQGHLNNAAIAVLLQEARIRYAFATIGPGMARDYGIVVGSIFIDYAGELFFPDPVEVDLGLLEIGRTSFVVGNVVRQKGRIAVYAEVALILTGKDGPMPIPDSVRVHFERDRIVPAVLT